MDKGQIIKHLVATEKATIMIDDESKLQFIVDIRANKNEIKDAVEMVFETPVKSIRTMITFKGEKKAIIDLKEDGKAREIGTSLGIL
ncbi:MAG: 50S ribosomal protein L23 [Euryarchaeota archaeon]|nr:50S ribosomal protein L23 [Euryarchaeota archaeon]